MFELNKSRKKNYRIVWLIFIFFAHIDGYTSMIVGSVGGTNRNFEFQDDLENVLFNNWTYLTIPTYEGSGQAIHPDVYYNASGWKGYKYWMTMTPYPNANSDFENPSIVTSNDGYNWEVPPGLTNPIVFPTSGYNSDPNLAFKNGTLYLYYREVSSGFDRLQLKSSTNGITWSPEQTALELPNHQLIAPAIVYNSADNLFYLWYVDTGTQGSQATSTQVILRNSNDGIHWSSPQIVPISIPGKIIWHINIQYIPELNEYWMVISAGTVAAGYKTELYFANSIDKLNWNVLPGKILGPGRNWDNYQIYQSAINYINNSVKIWYSAASSGTPQTWHIGYSETSLTDLKKDYHWEYYNKIGDFYRNFLQVKNGQYSAMLKFGGNVNEYVDVRRKVSDGQNLSSEIDFYDDGNTTGMKLFRVVNNINEMVGIGVWTISSSAFYSYHDKNYTYKITSIPRTVGWHKFRISIQNDKSSTFYIDDINVGALSSQFNDPVYVQLSSGFYKGVFYVDNLSVYQYSDTNTLPSITTHPGAQNVQEGQTAVFNVVAAGTLPLSYQWQKNGVNITGATGTTYTTPATTQVDNGSAFRVNVSNAMGSVVSINATLTLIQPTPVSITTQPSNQTVTVGLTATFSLVATGSAQLTYQWQKNGVNISGATNAILTTPPTTLSDNGSTFRVNAGGNIMSDMVTLTVLPTPTPTVTAIPSPTPTPTVTATPAPTLTPTSTKLSPEVAAWDANSDDTIQKSEAITAVVNYFSGGITKANAIEIVIAYFGGGNITPTSTTLSPEVAAWDANYDDTIQKSEAITAVVNYFSVGITKPNAIAVVIAYFSGGT